MSALKTNGASTTTVRESRPVLTYETEEPSYKGTGWILFATIMLGFAAAMSFIWGHRGRLELALLRRECTVHSQ